MKKNLKNNDTNYINGGFFVMSKKIFDIIPNRNVNFEKDVLPKILKIKN